MNRGEGPGHRRPRWSTTTPRACGSPWRMSSVSAIAASRTSPGRRTCRPATGAGRGFLEAMAGFGVAVDPALVVVAARYSREAGRQACAALLAARGAAQRPTAIVAANDLLALGLLRRAARRRARVSARLVDHRLQRTCRWSTWWRRRSPPSASAITRWIRRGDLAAAEARRGYAGRDRDAAGARARRSWLDSPNPRPTSHVLAGRQPTVTRDGRSACRAERARPGRLLALW